MSLTIRNTGNNTSLPIEMKGKGPFVFTFTPDMSSSNPMTPPAIQIDQRSTSNASTGTNDFHEKSCLLRELILLISTEDSIAYLTNFERNSKQTFGEYKDDESLIETIREVISSMENKNAFTQDDRIRIRMERLKDVHGIDVASNASSMAGGRKKRSTRAKKAPKRRTTKKH